MSDEDLVTAVSHHLAMPNHFVQVARDHNNDHHQRQSKNVAAYAKITGREWTFYVKRLKTNIGRPPEGYVPPPSNTNVSAAVNNEGEGIELPAADTEPNRVHIDIGPSKLVSRLHAEIYFDSDSSKWHILVNGRNGIKVDEQPVRRGQSIALHSGAVIEIAGVEMMFVLPAENEPIQVHKTYLQRAQLIAPDAPVPYKPSDMYGAVNRAKLEGTLPGQVRLAPAPPDYRKADTPVKQRARPGPASTPQFGSAGGTIIMNTEAIDYQNPDTAHVKPAFTYGQLISQAIMNSENEMATLNEIYEFMKRHYAHYRRPEFFKGWQNSIRHNLSLNAGFKVKQRGPEDTGKGGYWCFSPDMRDQMMADAWGPKSARKSPPKQRRDNSGTPEKTTRNLHGPGDKEGGSPSRRVKRSPGGSPALRAIPPRAPNFTPDRVNLPKPLAGQAEQNNGSPLPKRRRSQSPVLSSTYGPEEGNSLMTPAPIRKHPHLAPPSTAQRPSQHMPTSSPAPFWRFAEMGTPGLLGTIDRSVRAGTGGFDVSPLRGLSKRGADDDVVPSSSPAPKRRRSSAGGGGKEGDEAEESEEEPTFDLTRFVLYSFTQYTEETNVIAGAS
jgi:hypothetical protein